MANKPREQNARRTSSKSRSFGNRHHSRFTTHHSPRRRPPRVGDQLTLEVTDLTLEGEAIVRHGQYVLFVPGAIPGERVVVEIVSAGARFGRARVVRVVHA